jgi:hypothetical protein
MRKNHKTIEQHLATEDIILAYGIAISQFRRVMRKFFGSADSLVRVFLPLHRRLADKAVRAPLIAAWPR